MFLMQLVSRMMQTPMGQQMAQHMGRQLGTMGSPGAWSGGRRGQWGSANTSGPLDAQTQARLAELGAAADAKGNGRGFTAAKLKSIVPGLRKKSDAEVQNITKHLNAAMSEAGITSPTQQAAFVAQLAHESGGFKYMEELASGANYEGRRDLGNTRPGDGRRFKGRGPIQLTGRANYRAAGKALGLDLERNPELVSRPEVGFRVAAWYWNSRNINKAAGRGDFRRVTKLINGGYNGYADRVSYYQRALRSFA